MTDEIKERLQSSADQCLKSYEAWCTDKKDSKAREALQEAVHDLRKVASRLEIDIAISERNEMGQNKIPIPPHRDARGRDQNFDDDNRGNSQGGGNRPNNNKPRRRTPAKKSTGGQG